MASKEEAKQLLRRFSDQPLTPDLVDDVEHLVRTQKELSAGVFKVIAQALIAGCRTRWARQSRIAVSSLVKTCIKRHNWKAAKAMADVVLPYAATMAAVTVRAEPQHLLLMRWICIIASGIPEDQVDGMLDAMCDAEGALLLASAVGRRRVSSQTRKCLKDFICKDPKMLCKQLDAVASNKSQKPARIALLGALADFVTCTPDAQAHFNTSKPKVLAVFEESVLLARNPLPKGAMLCLAGLVRTLSHEELDTKIVPAVQRAVKRNSSVAIHHLRHVLDAIQLDLSQHAKACVDVVASHIYGAKADVRRNAKACIAAACSKSSDASVPEHVIETFTGVLAGKGTKVTQLDPRLCVAETISLASKSPLPSSSKEKLATFASDRLAPLVQKESHEPVKAHLIASLSAFVSASRSACPPSAVELVKQLVPKGGSPMPVREALVVMCLALFPDESLAPSNDVFMHVRPILVSFVDEAAAIKSAAQRPLEALAVAGHLLLKAAQYDDDFAETLADSKGYNSIMDGLVFVPRLFTSDSAQAIEAFVRFAVSVLSSPSSHLCAKANLDALRVGIVASLCHPNWRIRKVVSPVVDAFIKSSGDDTGRSLLSCFSGLVTHFNAQLEPSNAHEDAQELSGDSLEVYAFCDAKSWSRILDLAKKFEVTDAPSSNVLNAALAVLASSSGGYDQATALRHQLQVLVLAFDPALVYAHRSEYNKLVGIAGGSVSQLLESHSADLAQHLTRLSEQAQGAQRANVSAQIRNLVATLARNHPSFEDCALQLIAYSNNVFQEPCVACSSEEEVHIMYTPAGQLYNDPFADKSDEDELKKGRADYEDKKWELELRKELARKKGQELKPKVKLTKQQEEMRQKLLAKEAEIRDRMLAAHRKLQAAVDLLLPLLRGNASLVATSIPALIERLLRLVKASALACMRAARCVVSATSACHPRVPLSLRESLGRVLVRIQEPAAPVPEEWTHEDLSGACSRVIRSIWEICHRGGPLDEITIGIALPLLMHILIKSDMPASMEDALVLLSQHAFLGESERFARSQTLTLLQHVAQFQQRLAHQACLLLVELAESMAKSSRPLSDEEQVAVLQGVATPSSQLRTATLKSASYLALHETASVAALLWLACHDVDEDNAQAALEVWQNNGFRLDEASVRLVTEYLVSEHSNVRDAAAKALGSASKVLTGLVGEIVDTILSRYLNLLAEPEPERDALGNIIVSETVDPWPQRVGLAKGLAALAPSMRVDDVFQAINFMVQTGLGDRSEHARSAMLEAGIAIVDEQGQENLADMFKIFDNFLNDQATSDAAYDAMRQSVVVLLGSLAKHLDKEDQRLPAIIDTLLSALSTPAESVQEAVARCLPPLVQATKQKAPQYIETLMDQLMEGESYASRRGAAFGLAGVIKGAGIAAMKQQGVTDQLETAIQNKKNARHREGALMAFEMMSLTLGRLFEPYIIRILPHLLVCFGDGNKDVRTAAEDTARAIMSKLSGHGVKLVLPALLEALGDDSWRTKQGSAELLGAMAFCAPKQLSTCLPQIVPHLSEVLTDTHIKVQTAGREAINRIGSVIKNPEVQELVPHIIAALNDPTKNTGACLQALLETSFVHVIDAPSLALIMPIVERALRDRGMENKKKASQILGAMNALTEARELVPYLPNVMPGLQTTLIDPVPEVRAVAARALGALVGGIGEAHFGDLLPWLLETLRSENGAVDRAGAAQGLAEVLASLGSERLDAMMPQFLAGCSSPSLPVREGHLKLFVFLPVTFGDRFKSHVATIIPYVLQGLADVEEAVRDTAMRVGQRIIEGYSDQCIDLLLPELLSSLQSEDWRIRQSSVELLGDLLYLLSGTSGKKSTQSEGDDDTLGTESGRKALIDALGHDLRNKVLAILYTARQDPQLSVRQAAVHVWKVVVPHTVRTLREILSQLVDILLKGLASDSETQQSIAAKSLGELVRKLGERILPDIFPILESGITSQDATTRQGVCVGLSEIMKSCNRDHLEDYLGSLLPSLRKALCDEIPAVRAAAAQSFSTLHSTIGNEAITDVLPAMLNMLHDEDKGVFALDGLKQIMATKSTVVMPYLVPRLAAPPITAFNAQALASLAEVAGDALPRHLADVLNGLLDALEDTENAEYKAIQVAANRVVRSVDDASASDLVDELVDALDSDKPARRVAAASLLGEFCSNTSCDLSALASDLFRGLIPILADTHKDATHAAWGALVAVMGRVKDHMLAYLRDVDMAVSSLRGDKDGLVPGLCVPRGIEPFVPLYSEAILKGDVDQKETAAAGLGRIVQLTSSDVLAAYTTKLAGPLIRVVSEKHWKLKAHVVSTLALLLQKIGEKLKAFLPQLQSSFVKALRDVNKPVRKEAIKAMGELVVLRKDKRIDSLFTELVSGVTGSEGAIQESFLLALATALRRGGETASEASRAAVLDACMPLLTHSEDEARLGAGRVLGALCRTASDEMLNSLVRDHLLTGKASSTSPASEAWMPSHALGQALTEALVVCPERVVPVASEEAVLKRSIDLITSDHTALCIVGTRCCAAILVACNAALGDGSGPVGSALQHCSKLLDRVGDAIKTSLLAHASDKDVVVPQLTAVKAAMKMCNPIVNSVQAAVVPAMIVLAQTASLTVKKMIDRCLVHTFKLTSTSELEKVTKSPPTMLSTADANALSSYLTKSVSKRINEFSDDEDEL